MSTVATQTDQMPTATVIFGPLPKRKAVDIQQMVCEPCDDEHESTEPELDPANTDMDPDDDTPLSQLWSKRARTEPLRVANSVSSTNVKVFKCPHAGCDKIFECQSRLDRHTRMHTGKRPFKCSHPGCNKAFSAHSTLKSHMVWHTDELPYKCLEPGCDKAYKDRSSLARHRVKHTGTKLHKCAHSGCNMEFTQASGLKRHVNTCHLDIRPYVCTLCPTWCTGEPLYRFGRESELRKHNARFHATSDPAAV